MGDVYTRGLHYEKERDALREYLITDTVKMSLLIDPSLDSEELAHNLFLTSFESIDKLIEAHKGISQTLEERLGKESESKGATR